MVNRPIPYDLHIRNHSYILWIVTKTRQNFQILHVGIKIVKIVQLFVCICRILDRVKSSKGDKQYHTWNNPESYVNRYRKVTWSSLSPKWSVFSVVYSLCHLSTEFCQNWLSNFFSTILLTNKQTNADESTTFLAEALNEINPTHQQPT